jgi:thiol-disulfide isomerase/thioredoxin
MKTVTAYQFWNPTCRPCAVLKPMFAVMAEDHADSVKWVSVNTHDDVSGLKTKYSVTVVPTLVVVVRDESGNDVSIEKHSGSSVPNYYYIINAGIRKSKE